MDDDPTFCDIIRMALTMTTKWRVMSAFSAEEARALLTTVHPDVLLVDERMPKETGSELVRSLANAGALDATTAILVTAHRGISPGVGVAGVIAKPFDVLTLAKVIAGMVRHRSGDPRPS